MALFLLVKALGVWLVVGEGVRADPNLRQVSKTPGACPRCDMLFSKLEADPSGERVQHIDMVERGEGVCFVVRILPFDHYIGHVHYMGCSCTSLHNTLRRVTEIRIRLSLIYCM